MDRPPELNAHARQALTEMMAGGEPEAPAMERVFGAIQESVETDAPPRIGERAAPGPVAPVPITGWAVAAVAVLALAGAAALTLRGDLWSQGAEQAASSANYDTRSGAASGVAGVAAGGGPELRVQPATVAPPEGEATAVVPAPEVDPPAHRPAATRGSRKGRRAKTPPKSDENRDEVALLIDARRAVNAGEYSAAISRIRRHRGAFPTSAFAEERRVLEVRALCGAGQIREARRIVDRNPAARGQLLRACPKLSSPAK